MPHALFQIPGPRWLMAPVERMFGLSALRAGYERLAAGPAGGPFLDRALMTLDMTVDVDPAALARIPRTGPLVVAANHPTGIAEGLASLRLLLSVRPDVKALGMGLLAALPDLKDNFILVSIFGPRRRAAAANRHSVAEALAWLRAGHVLLVFPAGEVAHRSWRHPLTVREGDWNPAFVRLAAAAAAPILPFAFPMRNGALFQLAGFVHPRLRTALLVREFLKRRGTAIPVRIGAVTASGPLPDGGPDAAAGLFRSAVLVRAAGSGSMPEGDRLLAEGRFEVRFVPGSRATVALLGEIGRLRAEAFRTAGEGGGRTCDLDGFDAYYDHLLLWDRAESRLAGAYRLCDVNQVLASHGLDGLYTHSLFDYDASLFAALSGPAIELGRSFVSPDYQRAYRPLYLLWKGIGVLVARRPEVRVLFGAVSISASLPAAERARMIAFLRITASAPDLAVRIRPRHPAPAAVPSAAPLTDVRGLPVLVRRYLQLGGRFAAFSDDSSFGSTDGLVFLDLATVGVARLRRFMAR